MAKKAVALLEGRPLLEWAAQRLRRLRQRGDQRARGNRGGGCGARAWSCRPLYDEAGDALGPLAGVKAGLIWAEGAGVREEQLLAADLVVGDALLSFGRDSQSMNAWPSGASSRAGACSGFTSMTPYWFMRRLSPSTRIARSPRFLNDEPGAAVGQQVGVHRRRGVEGRPHALPRLAIPGALFLRRCRRPPSVHRLTSAMCVPLRSPRDTNGAPALLILRSASRCPCRPRFRPGRTSARR